MSEQVTRLDAVVVGAGFAGLYALHRLRDGLGLSVRAFEAGPGVGGTWFWNCYPGARCDVEALEYSYSFSPELEQEWEWSQRYPPQAEILEYINHVADRFDLRRDITLNTRVVSAHFDASVGRWTVTTDGGETLSATFCIFATGALSEKNRPPFAGLDDYQGEWYMTAEWPRDGVDLSGKRVGVVGTGSTGIQVIPQVAEQADHLTVFQRTANFCVPSQRPWPTPDAQAEWKRTYRERRAASRNAPTGMATTPSTRSIWDSTADERRAQLEQGWQGGGAWRLMFAYKDVLVDQAVNDEVAEFVRSKIREIVHDPATAERLAPRTHPIGTKRICVGNGYYETFNRDNVTLVDISEQPITEITPTGLRTADGTEYQLDAIVFAIGFDAMTGPLFAIDIRGRGGRSLREAWKDGPRTYLGLATDGFPNAFLITGPGSPAVLANMVLAIEQHVDWIADCIESMRERGDTHVEVSAEAVDAWMGQVRDLAESTLFPLANSWYVGANVPGKPRVFALYVGGFGAFREICDEVAEDGYRGFVFASSDEAVVSRR